MLKEWQQIVEGEWRENGENEKLGTEIFACFCRALLQTSFLHKNYFAFSQVFATSSSRCLRKLIMDELTLLTFQRIDALMLKPQSINLPPEIVT